MKNRELLLNKNFDCHVHTPYSDCCEDTTIEQLKEKARKLNLKFAITDHSAHLYFPKELVWCMMTDAFPMLFKFYHDKGRQAIEQYILTLRGNDIITGIELDIYPDETIVFEEDLFREFDIVIGSLHVLDALQKKKSPQLAVTEFKRLTRCLLSCGEVNILGHPFRILAKAGIPVTDELIYWVVNECRKYEVALEINSHYKFPHIDLKMSKLALKHDVLLVKGSDAHAMKEFGDYSYHTEIIKGLHSQEVAAL